MSRFFRGVLKFAALVIAISGVDALARDLDYSNQEVAVYVNPGEPTQLQFPGKIAGGYKKKISALSIERKDDTLIVFANDNIATSGEAIIVRLGDGRSYSLRVARASAENPRDDVIRLRDERGSLVASSDEEEAPYRERNFEYAPPTQVSGLMREMMLAAEFGKANITGYRVSDRYQGETVLNDGTMLATIDRIFIGPTLWGYVVNTKNLLDQAQRINPASFRLDGTRAISAKNWELTARPLNAEQQLAAGDATKVYIITRARKTE